VEVLVVLHVRHRDRSGVLPQGGLPLRGLAGDEAVEVVEAPARRRAVVGAVGDLLDRRVVVLAEGGRGVAVVAEHLGDGRRRLRDDAGVAVPVVGELGDLPAPTRWWLRPVISAARVGEHMAVVWKAL
jgi:hypothetical protein